jgi:hypothetical protein
MSSNRGERSTPAETHPPPITAARFEATPEFRTFKGIMRRLMKVPKSDLDEMVKASKERSPRAGNPNAPGRKRKS